MQNIALQLIEAISSMISNIGARNSAVILMTTLYNIDL